MTKSARTIVCSLFLVLSLATRGHAQNLVMNGNFTGVVNAGGTTGLTTLYGQFGPDPNGSPANGSTLTIPNWTTNGYNFVYAPGTVDTGTGNGANTGKPKEAPGQFSSGGYGTTYLWGSNNSGLSTVPAIPGVPGSNFVAADGAYEQASINQTISGLTMGGIYAVTFSWAAGQQQSFDGDTTEQWKVSLGSAPLTVASPASSYQATGFISLPSHTFSNWLQTTFAFTASGTTQTLSFLANGTPNGEPPFSLLTGVSLTLVPEPSAWMFFVVAGAVGTICGVVRRRRRLTGLPD